jgi:glycyl-tRNA synthetase
MLIVAERINASRKAIRAALEQLDAAAIQQEARAQDAARARVLDLTFESDGRVSLSAQTVTVRERDTMQQERIGLDALPGWLAQRLPSC